MALIAFDPTVTRPYSLKSDTGDDRTIFQLGTLDVQLRAAIDDKTTRFAMSGNAPEAPADVQVNNKQRQLDLVRFGLKGWSDNFTLANGNTVPLLFEEVTVQGAGKRIALKLESLKHFRYEWIDELAKEIDRSNTLTAADEKNSGQLAS